MTAAADSILGPRNPGGTRPNAIYHDNGSGGWLDKNNVVEGEFAHYCALGGARGGFGNGASCPGVHGEQEDCVTLPSGQRVCCTVNFVDNWLHMPSVSSRQDCQGAYSTKHHNKGPSSQNPPTFFLRLGQCGAHS